jgi:hypothetical protein
MGRIESADGCLNDNVVTFIIKRTVQIYFIMPLTRNKISGRLTISKNFERTVRSTRQHSSTQKYCA